MDMYQEALELTKQLVAVDSVNGTEGERKVGEFLYEYLAKLPYFQKHPANVWKVPLENDSLGRMNVFALVTGEKEACADTVILHGHTDTVGVEVYGSYQEAAFDCERLEELFREHKDELPEEMRTDLESGDYLFGRGACDMKSGVAVHSAVAQEMAEHLEEWKGNILLSFNPVEENRHTGMIEALDFFVKIREERGLHYLFAINNDYICGMYPGDTVRYVYSGSVGKLLPCFYIKGRETHVGQPFEGFDASTVAAELVREVQLNGAYSDGYEGEYPAPPSVLRMRELKPSYNVQTPSSAFVYFNYMVHNKDVGTVIEQLKGAARTALEETMKSRDRHYRTYCESLNLEYHSLEEEVCVLEYRELLDEVRAVMQEDVDEILSSMAKSMLEQQVDDREIALKLTEYLVEKSNITKPIAVLFFAPPFCPHNTLHEDDPQEKAVLDQIGSIMKEYGEESGETYQMMHFFPSLTDSSYLKLDDSEASIESLAADFPRQDLLYPVPYDKIRSLNIPAVNYGVWGKDAHKWMERVYKPYSFGKLPGFIIKTLRRVFE